MEQSSCKVRRCATYTRKSSAEGLEQDFNSLHAQRVCGELLILGKSVIRHTQANSLGTGASIVGREEQNEGPDRVPCSCSAW